MFTLFLAVSAALPASASWDGDQPISAALAVLSIERHGGTAPASAVSHYTFRVQPDGLWDYRPFRSGKPRKGQLPPDDLRRWLKELEDHGLFRLTGNEKLGENNEPFLLAELRKDGMKHRVKIMLEHPLAVRVDRKIIEMAKPMP